MTQGKDHGFEIELVGLYGGMFYRIYHFPNHLLALPSKRGHPTFNLKDHSTLGKVLFYLSLSFAFFVLLPGSQLVCFLTVVTIV